MRTSVFLTVLQGSWCSPLSPDPCTADRSHHTGGTFYDPCTLLQMENNSKTTCLFPPEKLISKWHTLLPPTPPVFLKFVYQLVMSLLTSFFLSFFFTWVTWVVAVMCPSCTNYQQPVVCVFTSLKVQLIILKLLTPPALEQLLCLLSPSLCPVFISCANTLRRFETKHCTVWKCHSRSNSLWVFLQ